MARGILVLVLTPLLSGCVAAAAVGAAGDVAGAAVGATGKVVGATIDAATPEGDAKENRARD